VFWGWNLGVGRLAFDITALGYSVQGNDFSLFMLLASDFILNGGVATPENPIMISPWLLESRNVHSPTDPLRIAKIPDVDPYTVLSERVNMEESEMENIPEFSMAAGEFAAIYSTEREQNQWDAVVCSFFLDTAPSIIEYVQIIHGMLKPGGFIMSFGPLLYHWSGPAMRPDDKTMSDYHERFSYLDVRYLNSVDICWEDVREIFINVGFEMVEEKAGVHSLYTADRRSMMNMSYRCVSFVARKKVPLPSFKARKMVIDGETQTHDTGNGSGGNSSLSSSAKSS
jgi:carnosine N-methyltransferase